MRIIFFFGAKKPFNKNENFLMKSLLILFFALLTPLFLHAEGQDSVVAKKNQEAVIYVSSGAEIQGLSYITNARIIKIEKEVPSIKKIQSKAKYATLKVQVTANINAKDESLKKLQQKINDQVKNYYFSTSQDIALSQWVKLRLSTSAASTDFNSFNFSKAFLSNKYHLNIFRSQVAKQKFYTSISYLQFGKYRNSSLRAPPSYC